MKYAIYDKAANGYLTDMDFTTDIPNTELGLSCKYNEHITEAKLLEMKETAIDAVTSIESYKFMEKGRFVIHSFDDTLNDQYIISEAGNPTKVVDNITVDLDGTVNVKYGTMVCHWHTTSLDHAINRMNSLQKAVSAIYTPWNDTFMVYKVITIMDEKEHTHYQFINRTITGLVKAEHDEEEKLLVAGKEIADITYPLNKRIEELEEANYELGEQVAARGSVANRLLDENNSLKAKVEAIKKEARDWKKLYENADADREELKNVIDIIHTDLASSTACDDLKDTLKAINCNSGLDNISMENFLTAKDEIRSIINNVIIIMESRELNQSVAFSATKDLEDQKKLNDANKSTIAYLTIKKMANDKELSDWKRRAEEAIRDYTKCNEALGEWKRKCKAKDTDYGMLKTKLESCEIALDSTRELLIETTKERDKALERAEFYKRQANSVYGMTIPTRCCGKQLMADILSGKKISIDKKKYDTLVEYVANLNLTYDTVFCMEDKPVYLSTITEYLNNLTK